MWCRVLADGIFLAMIEGFGSTLIAPVNATTLSFALPIVFPIVGPQSLPGRESFERREKSHY